MDKFKLSPGRPSLLIPGDYLAQCDKSKHPVIVVWGRVRYADVSWFNEPFQLSHRELFNSEDFRRDIEQRAEDIYLKYATKKSARAITYSIMTFYELERNLAIKAASDLFDMTMGIISEYESGGANK